MWGLVIFVLLVPSAIFAQSNQMNCEPLDPRVSITKENEAKVKASVSTVYKIAQANGQVERKVKEEIQNLSKNLPGKEQIEARWIYLFCETLRTSKSVSEPDKLKALNAAMRASKPAAPPSAPDSKEQRKTTPTDSKQSNQSKDGEQLPKEFTTAKTKREVGLLIDCRLQVMPITVPRSSDFYVIALFPNEGGGLDQYVFGAVKDVSEQQALWPGPEFRGEWVSRCQLTNYGDSVLLGLEMTFKKSFRQVIRDGQTSRSGAIVSSSDHPIEVPMIDGMKGTFVFYVYNASALFVEVRGPEYATLRVADEPERRRVPLMHAKVEGPPVMLFSPSRIP